MWGQYHSEEWNAGDPEQGWDYFDLFFRRRDWNDKDVYGQVNYTGNPPLGQVDVLPANVDAKLLKKYSQRFQKRFRLL